MRELFRFKACIEEDLTKFGERLSLHSFYEHWNQAKVVINDEPWHLQFGSQQDRVRKEMLEKAIYTVFEGVRKEKNWHAMPGCELMKDRSGNGDEKKRGVLVRLCCNLGQV